MTKHRDSQITTALTATDSSTGTRLGAIGAGKPSTSTAATWLAARHPAEVDRALASQLRRRGIALETAADGWRPVVLEGNPAALAEAVDLVSRALTPAPVAELEGWLAELDVLTKRRRGDELDAALTLRAYRDRLSAYPADVARAALAAWPDRSPWWPSWCELRELCEALALHRRQLMRELSRERKPAPSARDLWSHHIEVTARLRGVSVEEAERQEAAHRWSEPGVEAIAAERRAQLEPA